MTVVSASSFKIGAVDAAAGQAPVDVTTKVEKFDVDGPMAEALNGQKDKLLITTTQSGKLDSRNRYTADPNKKLDPRAIMFGSASASLVGPYIEFPEKAVNPGDTWDVTVPKGPTTSKEDQKYTATFVGEKDVDGKSVYVVSLAGKIKTTIDMGEIMKANPVPELEAAGVTDMVITGTVDISGEANVDKVSGQTLSLNLKLKSNQEISMSVLGDQKIPSVGTTTVKITLDK
jgi:hypothetical protein